jgi:hypothetical protein
VVLEVLRRVEELRRHAVSSTMVRMSVRVVNIAVNHGMNARNARRSSAIALTIRTPS